MYRCLAIAAALLILSGVSLGQPVYWIPEAPRVGDVLTIYYDTRPAGGLEPSVSQIWLHWGVYDPSSGNWSTPPQGIWPAGSRLHSDNIALQSPMTRHADSVFYVAIDFDTSVHDIQFVFTDGQSTWDNNNGNNWTIHFQSLGTVAWWTPEEPEPGDTIRIYYDVVAGTLPDGSQAVRLHWGVNEQGHGNWRLPPSVIWPPGTISMGQAAQTPMISQGNGIFALNIGTNDSIATLHFVFTDGTNWDNNNTQNWNIFLTEPPIPIFTWVAFRYDPRSAYATYIGANVNSLNLAGAFNGWSTTATPLTRLDPYGNRWGEVQIPVGANEYKFVANGNIWITDPDNPQTAGGGYNNSLLTAVVDSLPQVHDVQPGENRVFPADSTVVVTVRIRPGDLGPGLAGAPTVLLNGQPWGSVWNAGQSLLTLSSLPDDDGLVFLQISATDSAGRTGSQHLTYGFRQSGYRAVDAKNDVLYTPPQSAATFDLTGLTIRERAGGDSLDFTVSLAEIGGATFPMILLTASSSVNGWAAVPGLAAEIRVPDLGAGGAAILLLDPLSPHYNPSVHNRIHPAGDLAVAGPAVTFSIDPTTRSYKAIVAKSDLESSLGLYQSDWYYTCSSLMPASSADEYCTEITSAMGGVSGIEEPDVLDVLFMQAADVQTKLMKNYGTTRRATLDAPGRGVAKIHPDDIGPNVGTAGPYCTVLTRGAPTIDTTRVVCGRVTSSVSVAQAWLVQNNVWTPVTLVQDTFARNVTLVEGPNSFQVRAVDTNGDSGRSPTMIYTLVIDHSPRISITTRQEGLQGALDASGTTDPEQQPLTFAWSADPGNPGPVTLQTANTAVARFTFPTTPGEYYFNLTVTDPDTHSSHGRTLFNVQPGSVDGFSLNEAVDWVMNAMIYEIYPRSYSATGNLAGITADMQRIADLGVNCIWLMPIFDGPSDHGYEITNYYAIEQDYGTEQDLRDLVAVAHARGVRVILDMVINHTGIGHPFMQDALRHGRHSHYWDYYDRDASGNYTYYFDWLSLPNLNLNNPETAKYFIDMCVYWVEEFDIDGYRCDVAWGPLQRSPQFWAQWRNALKTVKPECLLLAEAGANDFAIFENRFDLAFDWNLHHEGGAAFSRWFPAIPSFGALDDLIANYGYPWPAYKNPLRFMENHDEDRFIAGNTPAQAKLAGSFCMSIPGAVMLYAGQEVGTSSQRGAILWDYDPSAMNPHYYRVTNARKLLPALRTGSWTRLANNVSASCYSFARYGTNMDPCVWVGNFSGSPQVVRVTLEPALMGIVADCTYTVSELIGGSNFTTPGSGLSSILLSLAPYQSQLWVVSDSIVSVDAPPSRPELPDRPVLHTAYPNPFNPATTLRFDLSSSAHVTLRIYDILGREVAILADGIFTAGSHHVLWDANASGRAVGSGLYFAVFTTEGTRQIKKLVLLR
ncbi:T9SS type A sorting domain-containing protein [bacterium]|nr:T9SS type A sorting domain-containing protein [bacterium]MBU1984414.1 T9SS type A sorting domain-containing protein [bacterium]